MMVVTFEASAQGMHTLAWGSHAVVRADGRGSTPREEGEALMGQAQLTGRTSGESGALGKGPAGVTPEAQDAAPLAQRSCARRPGPELLATSLADVSLRAQVTVAAAGERVHQAH